MTTLPALCTNDVLDTIDRRSASGAMSLAWPDQPLPPGCEPRSARVGVEVTRTGRAMLLVDRGIRYTGTDRAIRDWTATGVLEFTTFDDLRNWVSGTLAASYAPSIAAGGSDPASRDLAGLTDLTAVVVDGERRPSAIDAGDFLDRLRLEVRGHDDTLAILARRVREHVGRLYPRRPLTLFAVGPTGVGKTLAARTAADVLGDPNIIGPDGTPFRFLWLDMSEYQEPHRVSQLFGAPQGYLGYGDGAILTRALAAEPRTFVLFDEIEKAHPDVLLALLNAMDAGRIGDPSGGGGSGEIDCRQAIFFFTSNLDAGEILRELRRADADRPEPAVIDNVCRAHLRRCGIPPELVGRIRTFLPFDEVTPIAVAEIAVLSTARVVEEFGFRLHSVAPAVVTMVVQAGDTGFGARPLEYVVTALLADQLIDLAVAGARGDIDVDVDASGTIVVSTSSTAR